MILSSYVVAWADSYAFEHNDGDTTMGLMRQRSLVQPQVLDR
jgi:hypothetical protein